ncbi:hypothetical protein [Leptospira licerasiae]|uniref:hypothetical protein n=1 Tax=Leptospira licerasiae TaxID=447106 RepID=UPI0010824ADF|nr:hypothetical protein [Leptospira licerasiae]TGM88993.1 hypothetical protein EHR05_12390 [Leptospira licerasiae]
MLAKEELLFRFLPKAIKPPVTFCFSKDSVSELQYSDIWFIRHHRFWSCHPWLRIVTDDGNKSENKLLSWGLTEADVNQKDYDFYVSNVEVKENIFSIKESEISIFKASLLIRTIIRLSGFVFTEEGLKGGLSSFYNDSINAEVLHFRNFWKDTIYKKIESKNHSFYEQILSLYERIKTFFRSVDYVGAYSSVSSNNTINDEILYNFGYMILLAYGVFEDFAWIINNGEQLDLKKEKIGLRSNINGNGILPHLEKHYEPYFKLISTNEFQSMLNFIFLLRSHLVHRNYIKSYSYGILGESYEKGMISLSLNDYNRNEITNNVQNGIFSETLYIVENSNRLSIDPFAFAARLLYELTLFIDRFSLLGQEIIKNRYGG